MRDDPTLTLAAFGAFSALGIAFLLALLWGYSTVALVWLREAWERHQEDHRNWLNDQRRNDEHRAAALIPGGSYREAPAAVLVEDSNG